MDSFVEQSPRPIQRLLKNKQIDNYFLVKVYQYIFLKLSLLLEMIHKNHVIHYDIKPSNIAFDEEFNPLYIDYGDSEIMSSENNPFKL